MDSTIAYSALCRASPTYRQHNLFVLHTRITIDIFRLWLWTIITARSRNADAELGWTSYHGGLYQGGFDGYSWR